MWLIRGCIISRPRWKSIRRRPLIPWGFLEISNHFHLYFSFSHWFSPITSRYFNHCSQQIQILDLYCRSQGFHQNLSNWVFFIFQTIFRLKNLSKDHSLKHTLIALINSEIKCCFIQFLIQWFMFFYSHNCNFHSYHVSVWNLMVFLWKVINHIPTVVKIYVISKAYNALSI